MSEVTHLILDGWDRPHAEEPMLPGFTNPALHAKSPIKGTGDGERADGIRPYGEAEESPEIALLGAYVAQLGRVVAALQRRLDETEREQARRITVTHAQALQLQGMIWHRAAAICEKYGLADKKDAAAFRAAIKKAVLNRHAVRDLHDMPLCALDDAGRQIENYADISLVMERRRAHG